MLKLITLLTIFLSNPSHSVVTPGDLALVQIASNTLTSLRSLKEILTETREFGEEFERIHSKVEQGIWRADRMALWLKDMKELKGENIKNLDDFNYVLGQLKYETTYLRTELIKLNRKHRETNLKERSHKRFSKNAKKRTLKYSSEFKGSLSPSQAQISTANNTQDIKVEISRLNQKIGELTTEVSKLTQIEQQREKERLAHVSKDKEKLGQLDRGVLRPSDLRVKK